MDSNEFSKYVMERFPRNNKKIPDSRWPPGLMIHQLGMLTAVATQPGERLIPRVRVPVSYYAYSSTTKREKKDTEAKRKKRMALYNSYAVEGRMKGTVKNGFQWMKRKYEFLVHGS